MSAWLDPLRQTLDASDAVVDFFFRDDDAGWANDELRALLACFRRYSTPIDIAAIPAALTAELADEICTMREQAPELIGIHQHGFAHVNHEIAARKCEFGISRSAPEQYSDIQIGKLKLERLFGLILDPIFTPPWNRCTESTGQCLKDLGFHALSRDVTAPSLALSGLKELPISVDWFAKKNGTRLDVESFGALIADTAKQSRRPVGIMLHHERMTEDERHLVCNLLALLESHQQARCNLMGRIVEKEL